MVVADAAGGDRWWVVSAGAHSVCRWDVQAGPESGTTMRTGGQALGVVNAVAIAAPSGAEPVVVGLGIGVRLWRWHAITGELLGEQPFDALGPLEWARGVGGRPPVTGVDLGDRSLVVNSLIDRSLQAWDPATGALVGEPWVGHTDSVWSLTAGVLADGTPLVCSGGRDGLVRRWDARTGAVYGPPLEGCGAAVGLAIAGLPDGRTVVCVASVKGNVHRYDAATGERLGRAVRANARSQADAPDNPYRQPLLACLPTAAGGLLLTSLRSREVHCWDLASGQHLGVFDAGVEVRGLAAAQLPDASPVAVVDGGAGSLFWFDPLTGAQLGAPVAPHGYLAGQVWPVPLDTGRFVLVVPSRSGVRRFDAGTGQALGDPNRPVPLVDNNGHAVATLPDQRTLLVTADDFGITRLDLATSSLYEPGPDEQPDTIWDVATLPLPDGRVLIAGAGHGSRVYRWDAATGQAIGEPLVGHDISVKAITTTTCPDGTPMIISVAEGGQILRWHAVTGQLIGQPLWADMGMGGRLSVIHHQDGRQVLICVPIDKGSIQQWDPITGQPVGPTIAPNAQALLLATDIDTDGVPSVFLWIIGEGNSEFVRAEQWRLDTGTKVRELPANLRAVYRADGKPTMVLAHDDGSLTITALPTEDHQHDPPTSV